MVAVGAALGAGIILEDAPGAVKAPAADGIGAGNAIVTRGRALSASPVLGAHVAAAVKAVKTKNF